MELHITDLFWHIISGTFQLVLTAEMALLMLCFGAVGMMGPVELCLCSRYCPGCSVLDWPGE